MTESLNKLKELLGEERYNEITQEEEVTDGDTATTNATNAKDIYCECSTLIMKPSTARLILPSDSMLEVEKDLKLLKISDKLVKNIVRGCYWLVDDMFKFEQIGYTKEIDREIYKKLEKIWNKEQHEHKAFQNPTSATNEPSFQELFKDKQQSDNALRYLVCADCNTGPLGWFDSKTKESYLYVW